VGTLLTGESCGRARCAGQSQDRLVPFAMQVFPALLVNTLHLQVAEVVAFLHRNPTGHLNFAARSTEPCALHIAPAPTASFSRLVGQFARVGKSTRRMSRTFPRERFNLLRVADGFSAPVDRFSCAGQSLFLRGIGYPAHGICGRQTEQRKSKGWQDRLPPVLGTTHGFDMSDPRWRLRYVLTRSV
jgi:hypothetical protein